MSASVWGDGVPDEAFEIPPASIIKEQSTSYSIIAADAQKLLDYIGAGAATFTLPASVDAGAGFVINIRNSSAAGTLTIARAGSDTVESGATLSLSPGTAVQLILKATNYGLVFSRSIGAAGVNTTFAPAGGIIATNVQAAIEEIDAEKAALAGSSGQVFSVATATAAAHAMPKAQAEAAFVTPAAVIAQTHNHFLTTGTSAAFLLTPTVVQGAYVDGMEFSVQFHLAAGTTPTMSISGLAAKSLMCYSDAGVKQAITATTVPINLRSRVQYDGTDLVVLDAVGIVVTAAGTSAALTNGGALNQPASGDLTNCTSNTEAVGTNSTQLATTAFCKAGFVSNDVGYNAVGCIATVDALGNAVPAGGTIAGSSLRATVFDTAGNEDTAGGALSGTWRNLGYQTGVTYSVGTFQRIS